MDKNIKLDEKQTVREYNKDIVRPEVGDNIKIRSIAFTEDDETKLETLMLKYGVSRSAIVRILLASAE